AGAPRPSFRPTVEALEQRLVLDSSTGESLAPSDHTAHSSDPVHSAMLQVSDLSRQLAGQLINGKMSLKRIASLLKAEKLLEPAVAFLEATAPRDEHGNFAAPAFAAAHDLFQVTDYIVRHEASLHASPASRRQLQNGVESDALAFFKAVQTFDASVAPQ